MNKKLLFAAMSLVALAACTNDDFESQNVVAEKSSPVQFEVINDGFTRASMNGNKVVFSAADGDLFTLYHGGTLGTGDPITLTAYQNATYTAVAGDGAATLTTPSMILSGPAVMVWPVDTTFTNTGAAALAISIPAEQKADIENYIPYVSDVIGITAWAAESGKYNEAGYNRKYPVYMRPMGSQLIINADYAGTDADIAELYTEGVAPIEVKSMELLTKDATTTPFTTKVGLAFTAKSTADNTRWNTTATTKVANNAWSHVTGFDIANIAATDKVAKLTTKCLIAGNGGAKFLVLPQAKMTTDGQGVEEAAVVVRTNYGKVVVAKNGVQGSQYVDATEGVDAWYRTKTSKPEAADKADGETLGTSKETTGPATGLYKITANVELGLKQFFNVIYDYKHSGVSPVQTEPEGVAAPRYVKVLLKYLDMSDLHIDNDQWLQDAVKVWNKMGAKSVTVFLDGDDNEEFAISQETIETINTINAAAAKESTPRKFTVKPCGETGEVCSTIVITGGGDVPANLDFIVANGSTKADVALNEGETWKWAGTVTVAPTATTGIAKFINRGTMTNAETATLAIYDNAATPVQVNAIKFENAAGATWNVTGGDLTVQFDVTNYGTVNISKGAEYYQHIIGGSTATTFINEAETLEERFFMNDPSKTAAQKAAFVEKIGKVNNSGVFAVGGTSSTKGVINNFGLIEHADKDAKTFITANQTTTANFTNAFSASGTVNKLGRINLPFSNKDEDNISINAALSSGLVSVTVSTTTGAPADGKLNATTVGDKVNYVIINSGVTTITEMSNAITYIEFNDDNDTEIAWQAGTSTTPVTATYDGLIVLSPVNIKLYTTVISSKATYLGAKMYVGGTFTNSGSYNGYYGTTGNNESTMYITY